MMNNEFKEISLRLQNPFDPADVKWRVQQSGISKKGRPWMRVLPYITGRAIQSRLDEVFGPFNWEVKQEETKNCDGFICSISVFNNGRWTTKQDVSARTQIEALKGGASGALKRAGALWGIGRYLYFLEAGYASVVLCDYPSQALNKFDKIKAKDGIKVGVDWLPPELPAWALPGLDSIEFEKSISESCDLNQLILARSNAMKWASSFGKTDIVNRFTELCTIAKDRLDKESMDNISSRLDAVVTWLNYELGTLEKIPDSGTVKIIGETLSKKLDERCIGQYFDRKPLYKSLKDAVLNRIKSIEGK